MKRILCLLDLHDWEYVLENNIFPFTSYKYCSRCGKEIVSASYATYNDMYQVYTLEEFLEKFPYKVGDKVKTIYGKIGIINKPIWSNRDNCIRYELKSDTDSFYFVNELQPYKEETMEIPEKLVPKIDFNEYCKDKYIFDLGNYEIKEENGKTYAVRKQFEYPKTYEECCDVLKIPNDERYVDIDVPLDYNKLLSAFTELLICRNAYWKIAGEQMGLGKPLEPDWEDETEIHYTISYNGINIKCYNNTDVYSKLAFPTEGMRDAFYENFMDLIDICKELL
jgi:hypothetical protein